jgi:hypothetical protein
MGAIPELSKPVVTFLNEKEASERIESVFTELKIIKGLKTAELYGKSSEWIVKDEKAKEKFMKHLPKKGTRTTISYK